MSDVGTAAVVLRVMREGLLLVLIASAPPLIVSMVLGLVTGVMQAATQIQEQSLGFVPKLVGVVLCLIVVGPTLGSQIVRFTEAVLLAVPLIR